jgi:hypothetical protein
MEDPGLVVVVYLSYIPLIIKHHPISASMKNLRIDLTVLRSVSFWGLGPPKPCAKVAEADGKPPSHP